MPTKHIEPAAQITISGALVHRAELHNMHKAGYKLDLIISNGQNLPYVVEHWYEAREGVSLATLGHIADRAAGVLQPGVMVKASGCMVVPSRWRGRDVQRMLVVDHVEWANMAADHRLPDDLKDLAARNGSAARSNALGGISA